MLSQTCGDLPEASRIIQCGRTANNARGVTIKRSADGGRVYASGVVTCGNAWICLACSYKIRSKRARMIAQAVALHLFLGGGVLFGTFTLSHDRGEQLEGLWQMLSKGWAHMTAGGAIDRRPSTHVGAGIDTPDGTMNTTPDPKLAYSIEEAAELLSIKRDSIYELIHTDQLGSFKIGSRRLIARQHLEAFIESKVA